MSEKTAKCDRIVYGVFLILNIALPLIYSTIEIVMNIFYFENPEGPNRDGLVLA